MSSKKRILLIRSLESSTSASHYLTTNGIEVIAAPLMRSCKLHVEPYLVSHCFNGADLAICLSQNAAQNLSRYQGMLTQPDMYAIGTRTAAVLKAIFTKVQVPDIHTSEGLYRMLCNVDVTGRKVLILKGKGGRNWLQSRLQMRGATVRDLNLYERVPHTPIINKEAETIAAIDAIFVTSGELLLAALQTWGKQLHNHLWLVPSDRIAVLAKSKGIVRCVNVGSASIESMHRTFEKMRWNA